MNVASVAGVSGMRTAIRRHDVTAHDVANVNTPGFSEYRPIQTDVLPEGVRIAAISRTPNPDPATSNTDLATEAGEQIRNKESMAANARVTKVKDRMLGDLLDIVG